MGRKKQAISDLMCFKIKLKYALITGSLIKDNS